MSPRRREVTPPADVLLARACSGTSDLCSPVQRRPGRRGAACLAANRFRRTRALVCPAQSRFRAAAQGPFSLGHDALLGVAQFHQNSDLAVPEFSGRDAMPRAAIQERRLYSQLRGAGPGYLELGDLHRSRRNHGGPEGKGVVVHGPPGMDVREQVSLRQPSFITGHVTLGTLDGGLRRDGGRIQLFVLLHFRLVAPPAEGRTGQARRVLRHNVRSERLVAARVAAAESVAGVAVDPILAVPVAKPGRFGRRLFEQRFRHVAGQAGGHGGTVGPFLETRIRPRTCMRRGLPLACDIQVALGATRWPQGRDVPVGYGGPSAATEARREEQYHPPQRGRRGGAACAVRLLPTRRNVHAARSGGSEAVLAGKLKHHRIARFQVQPLRLPGADLQPEFHLLRHVVHHVRK